MDPAIKRVYTVKIIGGVTYRIRCQKALREAILFLLTRDGAMARQQLCRAIGAHNTIMNEPLEYLRSAGEIQRYTAISPKQRRAHEYWCIAGTMPTGNRYRAAETLEAFQIAAMAQLRGEVRA